MDISASSGHLPRMFCFPTQFSIIVGGLFSSVLISCLCLLMYVLFIQNPLNHFLQDCTPLFSIALELFHPDIIFRPPLDESKCDNFYDMSTEIIENIYQISKLGITANEF